MGSQVSNVIWTALVICALEVAYRMVKLILIIAFVVGCKMVRWLVLVSPQLVALFYEEINYWREK